MIAKKEIRTFALRAYDGGQAGDPEMTLRGRALSYGKMSQDLGGFKERFAPGAFTRALKSGADCKCLFNHNADRVLGRTQNGTLSLVDSRDGLDFKCTLDPNQQAHRDLHAAVKRGDIDACSFAFDVDGDDGEEFDEDTDDSGQRYNRRTVRCAKLYDVSVVTHPAYPGDATSVQARNRKQAIDRLFPTTRNSISYEERFFRQHGFEWNQDALNRQKLARVGAEVKRDLQRGKSAPISHALRHYDQEFHKRNATRHLTLARRCKNVNTAVAHFEAADFHLSAAANYSTAASSAARLASDRAGSKAE
jgi:uncharacterized protein